MEVSNTGSEGIGKSSTEHISLVLAITLSLVAFLFAFAPSWIHSFGLDTLPRIATAFSHPQALSELIAESVGASLLIPAAHVASASPFKSKRNPSSRRRIFIGWSLATIVVGVLSLWTKSRGL